MSVFKYIEGFYNTVRIHQTLGYLSPNQYEAEHAPAQQPAEFIFRRNPPLLGHRTTKPRRRRGQPSIPPGVYFRMLLIGYFEGIDSQRGIAWRCADSRSLAEFLGYGPGEATPDHSTLTNTRKRLPAEVFDEVFQFVLTIAAARKLIDGKTVGVDSTTLEANAAMKSIIRRDTGEDWKQYVTRLMREEGRDRPGARADRRGDSPLRQGPQKQEGLQRRVVFAQRRRGPHHATQGRADALGLQGRARRGPEDGSGSGGRDSSG